VKEQRPPSILLCALFSLLLIAVLFALQGRIGLDLMDEGFQWYGSLQTAHGGIPLRDFYAYDPGRYLWAAAWSWVLGDGIVALRLSTAAFAAIGLTLGLLAVRRVTANRVALALAGALLALWMFPRHKLFEPTIAMAAVLVALRLIEEPSRRRHFAAGALVGVAAFFGKNHGLYTFLAFLGLVLFLHFRIDRGRLGERSLALGGGIAAGSIPLLAMMVFVPGFLGSYVDSILFFLTQGRTNNPLPVPWPWRVSYADVSLFEGTHRFALGLAFLLLPVFCVVAAAFAVTANRESLRRRAPLLAAAFVALLYLHHAMVRADAPHLGQSIHPVLLGLLALPLAISPERRLPAVTLKVCLSALLVFLTVFAALPESPFVRRLARERNGEPYVRAEIGGDPLSLPSETAALLSGVQAAVAARVAPGEPLLILPYYPGLYPVTGHVSPVWNTYLTWPDKGGSDERMIREIREHRVRWALVGDHDGHGGFGFRTSHPVLVDFLTRHFAPIPTPGLPPGFLLLREADEGALSLR
jgi:hypothetical protein